MIKQRYGSEENFLEALKSKGELDFFEEENSLICLDTPKTDEGNIFKSYEIESSKRFGNDVNYNNDKGTQSVFSQDLMKRVSQLINAVPYASLDPENIDAIIKVLKDVQTCNNKYQNCDTHNVNQNCNTHDTIEAMTKSMIEYLQAVNIIRSGKEISNNLSELCSYMTIANMTNNE